MGNTHSPQKTVGETLKKIRESKNYTQKFVTQGIIGQPTYSKIERGEVDPTYPRFISLLRRLDVSEDEFHYLMEGSQVSEKEELLESFFMLNFNEPSAIESIKKRIVSYLSKNKDFILQDIYFICEALLAVSLKNDFATAKKYAEKVWARLEKFDYWYLMEIRLINAILFIFPPETAISISQKIVSQLRNYQTREGKILLHNIQLNLTMLLIENNEYDQALEYLEDLVNKFKTERNYHHLAIVYARKGVVLENLKKEKPEEFYEKAFRLMEAMEEYELKKAIQEEVNHYTKKSESANNA